MKKGDRVRRMNALIPRIGTVLCEDMDVIRIPWQGGYDVETRCIVVQWSNGHIGHYRETDLELA